MKSELDIKELEAKKLDIEKQISEYYKQQCIEKINQNKGYIGKTFKRTINNLTYFYKIISVDENNFYRMYTFYFIFPNKKLELCKNISLCGIDSIGWFCWDMNKLKPIKEIELYEEINNDYYDKVFKSWIDFIKF